jgi:iron complex transport system substrate-binding protein
LLHNRFARAVRPLALACALACGSSSEDAPPAVIEVRDDAGQLVRLRAPATRIVSLIPARTDALLALGAADRLIARTRWDEDPAIAHVASVDNALTPSVEWLIAQSPDLVIAWPDGQARTVVTRLRELGVPVYASAVETVADVERALDHLGTLLGLETRADSLLARIRGTLDSVRTAAGAAPDVDVAYVLGWDPPTVAGPGTFIHEMLVAAGGRNVFDDAPAKWPQLSVEAMLRRSPQVLIVASGGEGGTDDIAGMLTRPGWRDLPAVQAGRVFTVDADEVNRPGPSLIVTVRRFADILHPDGGPR